jgi:hypothetical protein
VAVARSPVGHSVIVCLRVVVRCCHYELLTAIPSICLSPKFSELLHRGYFGDLCRIKARPRHSPGLTTIASVDVVNPAEGVVAVTNACCFCQVKLVYLYRDRHMMAVLSSFPSWSHRLADPLVLPLLACGGLIVSDVHVSGTTIRVP